MSENDMVMSSAAAKFSSLASRFATIFCTVGSKFVVLHQAKVGSLQTAVVLQRHPLQILWTDFGQGRE